MIMAGSITIVLKGSTNQYRPEQKIYGTVHWNLPQSSEQIELSLLWYTIRPGPLEHLRLVGGGSTMVDSLLIQSPLQIASQDFEFSIPIGPYTYTGKLFSIIWGVLAVSKPDNTKSSIHLTVHPNVGTG